MNFQTALPGIGTSAEGEFPLGFYFMFDISVRQ